MSALTVVNVRSNPLGTNRPFNPPLQVLSVAPRNEVSLDLPGEKELRLGKVQTARGLARKIKDEVHGGNLFYWIPAQKKIGVRNFLKALLHAARRLELDPSDIYFDKEVAALTAYNCLRTRMDLQLVREDKKEEGFLEEFPYGLFDRDLDHKIRILAKHYLVDLRELQTPEDLENTDNYKDLFLEGNLKVVLESFGLVDLLKLLFPGYLEGENPLVRERYLKYPDKWNGEGGLALIVRSLREILRYDFNAIRGNGSYDVTKLESINWGEIFNDKRYGLKSALSSCPYVRTPLEALDVACPDLIGLGEARLNPWKVRFNNMWQVEDEDGTRLIDNVTEYLLERKLKCIGPGGAVCAEKVKGVKNWDEEFGSVASGCLQRSGLKAHEAIKRRYPHLFGYGDDQIKPWEIRFKGMWNGSEGEKLFRLAFAYSLWKSGLGNFNTSRNPSVYSVSVSEFENWYEDGLDVRAILTRNGLSGALKSVAGDSLREAVRVLFEVEDRSLMPDSRNIRVVFCELLRSKENRASELKAVEFPLSGEFTLDYFVRRQRDPMPWDLAKLRAYYKSHEFYSAHQLRNKTVLSIFDPGKYLEDGDVLNFTRLAYDMLIYSLRNSVTVDEVFKQFAISVVDLDEDKNDSSHLYPCEVFNLACNLNRFSIPDDIEEAGDSTFQEFDYKNALTMVIQAFEIPGNEKGKEILDNFVWHTPEAQRFVDSALSKVKHASLDFVLKAA